MQEEELQISVDAAAFCRSWRCDELHDAREESVERKKGTKKIVPLNRYVLASIF